MTARVRRQCCCAAGAILMTMVPAATRAAGAATTPRAAAPGADGKTATTLVVGGVKLYKGHDYEGARSAFAQAYALDPQPGTLLNLALSELKADQPVQAAAHFREYLKASSEPEDKLQSVRTTYLPLAESKTARLDIYASAPTEILVDGAALSSMTVSADAGVVMGRVASVLVRAGEHDVAGHDGSFQQTQRVVARGGEIAEVHLEHVEAGPTEGAAPPSAAQDSLPGDDSARGRTQWITVLALGSSAVVAAGLGVGFAIAAGQQASDAQTISSRIDPTGAGSACFGAAGSSASCMTLNDETQAARRNWTLSIASYVGAGVLGAASLATWMLWRPTSPAKTGVRIAPALSARNAGFALEGNW